MLLHGLLFLILFVGFGCTREEKTPPAKSLIHATVISPSQLPGNKRGSRRASEIAEAKKHAAEEARRRELEQKKAEEAKRQAEEQKRIADIKRIEEQRKAEEAKKQAEEQKKVEEAKKQAEEQKKAEEAKKQAEEQRKAEEAKKKLALEKKKKEEEAKKKAEEEKRKAEEAKKKAEEEKRKAEEAKKKAEEDKRRAAEAKQKAEAERQKKLAQQAEDDLFKELGDGDDDVRSGGGSPNGADNSKEIQYGEQVRSLIERYWHVDRSMKGKKGVVTLNIDLNGKILSKSCSGDANVCAASLRAVSVIGSLPKPPSAECLKMNLTMKPQI